MKKKSGGGDIKSSVRVAVRIRPLLKEEITKQGSDLSCVRIEDSKNGEVPNTILMRDPRQPNELKFTFDAGYEQSSTQEQLFNNEVAPYLESLYQGYNTTVFCYGITGSGKTYTMQGSQSQPGIIYRAAQRLLDLCAQQHSSKLTMSYLEVYNEGVYDLLRENKNIVKELSVVSEGTKIVTKGLTNTPVTSYAGFMQSYTKGLNNRKVAKTKLNSSSSRSHAILTFNVSLRNAEGKFITGKLNLADLAGSEDNRRTGNKGEQLTESTKINMSLMVLRRVVHQLNQKLTPVPYRDSKLTRLLQDSLGGSSQTLMICNVSPLCSHYHETYSALEFSNKSKNIVNNVVQAQASLFESEAQKQMASKMMTMGYSSSGTIPGFENLEQSMIVHNLERCSEKLQTQPAPVAEVKEELAKMWKEMGDLKQKLEFNSLVDMNNQLKLKALERNSKESSSASSSTTSSPTSITEPKTPQRSEAPTFALTPASRATEVMELLKKANAHIKEKEFEKALYFITQANTLDPSEKIKTYMDKVQKKVIIRRRRREKSISTPSSEASLSSTTPSDVRSPLMSPRKRLSSQSNTQSEPKRIRLDSTTSSSEKGTNHENVDKENVNPINLKKVVGNVKLFVKRLSSGFENNVKTTPNSKVDEEEEYDFSSASDASQYLHEGETTEDYYDSYKTKLLDYVNSETRKNLIKLGLVGEKTADKILANRPFKFLEDISKVGLSVKRFMERNEDSELFV
ncbi:kinesin-like protein [Acrasis kona]|uniref:Kinesin-like protein n=1 Tax=Acrasis kona TaxID=1008807 RepID=A0AAW2YHD6_9EUKA